MNIEEAKRRILSKESYSAVAKAMGMDALDLHRQLSNDPDIVAAKASGQLNKSRNRPVGHFSRLPHVIDVLRNGMSQKDAAIKHGKHAPQVSRDVRKALQEQQANPEMAAYTPEPTPNDHDLNLIADMLRSAAQRLGMRPEALAHDMIRRLAD